MLEHIAEAAAGYLVGYAFLSAAFNARHRFADYRRNKAELEDLNAYNLDNGLPTFGSLAEYDQWAKEDFLRRLQQMNAEIADAEEDSAIAEAATKKANRSAAGKKAAATRKANAEAAKKAAAKIAVDMAAARATANKARTKRV